jgi:hypothetical protein
MLQVRISTPEFSDGVNFVDPIVLEKATDISLRKTVSSSEEGIQFKVPINDIKTPFITYLRWWECWDTETNTRLNYGPIESINRSGGDSKSVSGPGRSALFRDYYKSIQTFYYPINVFLDDLRYENLSSEPRTTALINQDTSSAYYGVSKRSKDYVIDEQTGYVAVGRDTPSRGVIKTSQFWSGIGRADHIIVDLGEKYKISKSRIILPWWGGSTQTYSRTYDWSWQYSNDNEGYTSIYTSPIPNYSKTTNAGGIGQTIYTGESGFEDSQHTATSGAIDARYWKLDISNTHAWYGNFFVAGTLTDEWAWECGGSNTFKGDSKPSPATTSGSIIPTTDINPNSDCYASVIELSLMKKIVGMDTITDLAYHQIQGDNKQITYWHMPTEAEMIGGKKFEPGTFFRKIKVSGSPGKIKDEYNTIIADGNNSGNWIKTPAYCRLVLFESAARVLEVDTWPGKMDAFSYGGSYSYSEMANDYAILNFRGISIKWFATIPSGKTPGTVSIELRSKTGTDSWSDWDFLEDSLTLPSDVSGTKVWEITVESEILVDETSYQLRITNLDGGFVSIDAFAGYWSATMSDYNEDHARISFRIPAEINQIFDSKFTNGSAYKFIEPGEYTKGGLGFMGDRVIIYSRKGVDYGLIDLAIIGKTSVGEAVVIHIPGGNPNGTLTVDLDNPTDVPQFIVFDSNDYFENGLPWDWYSAIVYKPEDPDPMWVDGWSVHETNGLSVKFMNTNYLDIIKSTSEALQMEWDVTELGLKIVPRLGEDTEIIFAEGRGTTIDIDDTEDIGEVATMLLATGADIDGLPMSTIVEDKKTRAIMGRTIQRTYDSLRNTADYFTLIGASRTELIRRREPQKRVTVKRATDMPIHEGDSFIVKKAELELRVRANSITRTQSNGGTEWSVECVKWPAIA